jgi:pimeloyl-ACP methyl ester carboxylesterase
MDGRGHGASDKPHEPEAYEVKPLVDDVLAVLDSLDLPKATFLGYSWGGWIGYGLALYAPERFDALLLGGNSPYVSSPKDADWLVNSVKSGIEGFAAVLDTVFAPEQRSYKIRRLEGDLDAYLAASIAMGTGYGPILDPMSILKKNTTPLLLYAGEHDGSWPYLQEVAPQIPNATFISFPGLNHFTCYTESATVLPEIMRFLEGVRASTQGNRLGD